jgi:hypothetical protein
MHKSKDPPSQKTPRVKLGVLKTKSPLSNSVVVPLGNTLFRIKVIVSKVKPRPQLVVDKNRLSTTFGGNLPNSAGISADQQALLNRFDSNYHHLALLLALDGALREEHCEAEMMIRN